MFYATLRGLTLFMHKDDNGFRPGRGVYAVYRNAVRVHHSIAFRPTPAYYDTPTTSSKRQHVFAVRTADLCEYLFETRYVCTRTQNVECVQ
jgi:hypothetical protein